MEIFICICVLRILKYLYLFILFINILVYKLLFFTVFILLLHLHVKLFADDTIFSVVNDENESFENLSNDICIQWKMSFNRDRSKQSKEVIFSRKTSIQSRPVLTFVNSPVIKTTHHKHLGWILNEKINFKEHLKEKSKSYKGIAVLRKL